jgi:hypothetical protein
MLAVFLHGPPAEFILIAFAVVAAIALLGAGVATVIFGRGSGAGGVLAALLVGTLAGFGLAYGFFIASMTSLAWMFKGVSGGVLITLFVGLALSGGFAVAALVGRFGNRFQRSGNTGAGPR